MQAPAIKMSSITAFRSAARRVAAVTRTSGVAARVGFTAARAFSATAGALTGTNANGKGS